MGTAGEASGDYSALFLQICLRSVGINRMNTRGQKCSEHTLTVAMKFSIITMTSGASRRQGKARYGSA